MLRNFHSTIIKIEGSSFYYFVSSAKVVCELKWLSVCAGDSKHIELWSANITSEEYLVPTCITCPFPAPREYQRRRVAHLVHREHLHYASRIAPPPPSRRRRLYHCSNFKTKIILSRIRFRSSVYVLHWTLACILLS